MKQTARKILAVILSVLMITVSLPTTLIGTALAAQDIYGFGTMQVATGSTSTTYVTIEINGTATKMLNKYSSDGQMSNTDEDVVDVSIDNGTVTLTGKKAGTATVTVSYENTNGHSKTVIYNVTVNYAGTLTVDSSVDLTVGATKTINPTYSESDVTYEWSSADKSVATVADDGTITGIKVGTTTVTVQVKKGDAILNSANVTVNVTQPATGISITGSNEVTVFDEPAQLTANLEPEGATGTVSWYTDSTEYATVDDTGLVTGVAAVVPVTITVYAALLDDEGNTIATAEHQMTVNPASATSKADFYYLLDPTKDPMSNSPSDWGPSLGLGTVNLTNITWTSDGKNSRDNVSGRVIS